MLKKIANKKGGTIVIFVMMMAFLFPVIITGLIDLSNIFKIQKRLKTTLNASVKSASSRVDWDYVPDGEFKIDENEAERVFIDIFNANMEIELEGGNGLYAYTSKNTGRDINVYFDIYNERHKDEYTVFPESGTIPKRVTDKNPYTHVDRPTAIGVATVKYRTSRLMGNKLLDLTQFASSQLNISPDVGETIENNIDGSEIPDATPIVNPNLIDPEGSFAFNCSYLEVTKTRDKLNGYPIYKVYKKGDSPSPIELANINIGAGDTYTVSVWIKSGWQDSISQLGFYRNGEELSTTKVDKVGDWTRFKTTYKNDTGNALSGVKVCFYPTQIWSTTVYFSFPKVEKGGKATG